jgi:hypothetical protein
MMRLGGFPQPRIMVLNAGPPEPDQLLASQPPLDNNPVSITITPSTLLLQHGSVPLTGLVKNVSGETIPGLTPGSWSSDNEAAVTVDGYGVVTYVGDGVAHITATGFGGLISNTCTVTALAPVVPNSLQDLILSVAGPTVLKADMPAEVQFWDNLFEANAEQQWEDFGPAWDAGNTISEYDRPMTYYVEWVRTGDVKWLNRANEMVVNYIQGYLIPAEYATSPHFSQMESLYLYYMITGDEAALIAMLNIASKLSGFIDGGYIRISQGEARIQARIILAMWVAERVLGVNTPVAPGNPKTYTELTDQAIDVVLSTMNSDGWAPFVSTCGGSLNYMTAMLADTLTRIHDQRPGVYNPAIRNMISALGNYLWSTQWRGSHIIGDDSFNYISLLCDGTGSPTSSPDLNGMFAAMFGWLYKTTGDVTWATKFDQILQGMQESTGIYLYRQWSEQFNNSYRGLGYRYGA